MAKGGEKESLPYRIVAGLGNPGSRYENTPHNIGFRVVDALSSTGSWREKEGLALSEVELAGDRRWLVKPQEYMNLSGVPLVKFMRFHKILPVELIVVQDEVDLPLGAIRLKKGGGHGGHNGIKSVEESIGSRGFTRVRVGVGRPSGEDRRSVSDWVLGRFEKGSAKDIEELVERATQAVTSLCESGLKLTQNKFND